MILEWKATDIELHFLLERESQNAMASQLTIDFHSFADLTPILNSHILTVV
jgi:hypothetical protein